MNETKTSSTAVEQPHSSPPSTSRGRQPWGLLVLWSAVVALPGGYACGHALAALGIMGSFSLLLLGVVAGWTARNVVGIDGKFAAACLSAACLIACLIALVYRLRLTDPTMSWSEATSWSLSADQVFAMFAIGCAIIGGAVASLLVLRTHPGRKTDRRRDGSE